MWLNLKFLKMAIQVQGWVMFAFAILAIRETLETFETLFITIGEPQLQDEVVKRGFTLWITVFWIYSLLLLAISLCGILGSIKQLSGTNNTFQRWKFLIFMSNIAALTTLSEITNIFIGEIIFILVLGVMIVFACCFTYHPELEKDNYHQVRG